MSNETPCQDCGLAEPHNMRQCVERLKEQLAKARLEEAEWWNVYSGAICKGRENCAGCKRMQELEQSLIVAQVRH